LENHYLGVPVTAGMISAFSTSKMAERSGESQLRIGKVTLITLVLASPAVAAPMYSLTDLGLASANVDLMGQYLSNSGIALSARPVSGTQLDMPFVRLGGSHHDIVLPPGFSGYGRAINDSGQVAGMMSNGVVSRGFVWDGVLRETGTLGGSWSDAIDINDSGRVTGYSGIAGDTAYRAFVWQDGSLTDLGTLGGSFSMGRAINSAGHVAGFSLLPGNTASRAFLWDGATMQNLGTLGGDHSYAMEINDAGQVLGTSRLADGMNNAPFIWTAGTMRNLGSLGGLNGWSTAMNENGQAIGVSQRADGSYSGFFWDGSTLIDLNQGADLDPWNPWIGVEPLAVNDQGIVVGRIYSEGGSLAFLWKEGVLTLLRNLIDAPDWILFGASDINDAGQIIGYGAKLRSTTDDLGLEFRAFLLTPNSAVPEPASLLLFMVAIGLLATASAHRRMEACRAASHA
jgi:probable HAF family extracellular repeat protein